jgi:hypothetical protein
MEKIKLCLCDQFQQNWNDDLQTCSKAINYRIFIYTFGFEDYFNILDENAFLVFCKLRTVNRRLPIECSRWQNLERES